VKYEVTNIKGEKVKVVDLNPAIFEVLINEELVHQSLVAQDSNRRTVLAHTKGRSEVRGGGRKPWRQKGTGRARAGSSRSPIWRGGGVTFGPTKDRNFSKSINKKMKRKALFMGLSDRAQCNNILLLDQFKLDEAKTKNFVEVAKVLFTSLKEEDYGNKKTDDDVAYKTLVITPESDNNLILASRNLKKVKVIRADSLNIRDILMADKLIIPVDSLAVIEKTYL